MISQEELIKYGIGNDITERQIWEASSKLSNGEMQFFHFYYKISDLLDKIGMRTSYHGKFTQTAENVTHSVDRMSISKDDNSYFLELLHEAADDIFSKLCGFAKFEKSYFFNESKLEVNGNSLPVPAVNIGKYQIVHYVENQIDELLIANEDTNSDYPFKSESTDPNKPAKYWKLNSDFSESVHFIFLLPPTAYKSMISVIDNSLKNALIKHVMYRWYEETDFAKSQYEKVDYDKKIKDVKRRMNSGFSLKTSGRYY